MKLLLSCTAAILFLAMAASSVRADEEAIKTLVLDAQRAGFEQHNFEKYMTLWADDARIIWARSEQPGNYELTYNRQQIEATRRFRFRGKPQLKVAFSNVAVKVNDDEATLRLRSEVTTDTGSETGNELYRLRRTDDGWKVYENRYWPIRVEYGDEVTSYDAKKWRELDAKVDVQRLVGSPYDLTFALLDAWRFREAHQVAVRFTADDSASANDWALRGRFALYAGNAEDAKKSFAKAKSLDPEVNLPPYARVKEVEKEGEE